MNKRLSLIKWDEISSEQVALKLERCAIRYRNKRKPLDEIFSVCSEKKPYATMILYNRLACLLGKDDTELQSMREYLFSSDDFLTAVYLRNKEKARGVFQNIDVKEYDDKFYEEVVESIQNSNNIENDICFILNCSLKGRAENIERLNRHITQRFLLPSDNIQSNPDLREYVLYALNDQNFSLIYRLLFLFHGLNLIELTDTNLDMWREIAIGGFMPYSMIVYKEILMNLQIPDDEICKELKHFLTDEDDTSVKAWNNYLFFGYEVAKNPESAQKIIDETKLPILTEMPPYGSRLMVYREVVEKTFWILTKQNPTESFRYLNRLGRANLADYSFQQDAGWKQMRFESHLREPDYRKFVKGIASSGLYSTQELIDYYMNSPLRYYVPIDWFMDIIFQGDEFSNVVYLEEFFSSYILLGSFISDRHHRYREISYYVSLRNINCAKRKYIANSHDASIINILNSKSNGDIVAVRPSVFLKTNHFCKVNYLVEESQSLSNL